jgi:hypothetical protein
MLLRILSVLLLPVLATAAIWPDALGQFQRASRSAAAPPDASLWSEFGFQEGEQALYAAGDRKFEARAYRFQDSTGAMAAFQWQRPADAKPSPLATLAVATRDGVLINYGNYLLSFAGYTPKPEELPGVYGVLPKLEVASLPSLIDKLPAADLRANSGRYILGPRALAAFEPRIPPATAGFHMGTEAQAGVYRTGSGDMRLLIFSFPTPQIARQKAPEFEAVSGAMVKRAGPLLGVIVSPADVNAAEHILSGVRYEATISWSEHVPTQKDNVGDLVVNAFILVGILLLFAFVSSLLFGGVRVLLRRGRHGADAESMILLHLDEHR